MTFFTLFFFFYTSHCGLNTSKGLGTNLLVFYLHYSQFHVYNILLFWNDFMWENNEICLTNTGSFILSKLKGYEFLKNISQYAHLLFIYAFYGNIMNGIMASYKIRVKDVVPFIDAIKQYLPWKLYNVILVISVVAVVRCFSYRKWHKFDHYARTRSKLTAVH